MFYKFYSDWAYLTKQEVGILCSVASMGGSYEGSPTELYKLTQLKVCKTVNQDTINDMTHVIFDLESRLFLKYDFISDKKIKIDLIKRGMEIKIHEILYSKIKQKHEPSVAWQIVIKLLLFLIPVEYVETKNIVLGYVLNIETSTKIEENIPRAKESAISKSKRVLVGLNVIQDEQIKERYEIKGEEKTYTKYTIFRCAIPPEYSVNENE